MEIWKMISLFKQVILRLHVNFPGCTKFQGRNVFNFEGFEPFVGPEMSVNLMTGVPPWCFWGREFLTSTSTSRVKLFSANFRCELVWRCLVFQILSESNLEIEKNNTRDPTLGINWKNNHRCSNKKSPCVLPTKKVVKTPQRGGVNPVILGGFLEAAFFFPSLQGLRVVHPQKGQCLDIRKKGGGPTVQHIPHAICLLFSESEKGKIGQRCGVIRWTCSR